LLTFALSTEDITRSDRIMADKSADTPATIGQKAIFIVDDDLSMRLGISRLLKQRGFKTELFDSAEDFHAHAEIERSHCLVLDIKLKENSGIDLRRALANAGISIPVIFVTADDSDKTRRAATAAGCVAYLTKPFSSKALIDAVERAVEKGVH
jgi:FixJ family two-component response regulator